MSDTRKDQHGTTADKRTAQDSGTGSLRETIGNELKKADESLAPYSETLKGIEGATRQTADVLEQGVKETVNGLEAVSNAKGQIIQQGLGAAGRAINDSHVLDAAKPAISDALHKADEALDPVAGALKTGEAVTGAAAKTVVGVAETTGLKQAAEIVSAMDDVYSVKEGVSKVGELGKEKPHGVGSGEPHGPKRPGKEPEVTPRLADTAEPAKAMPVTAGKPLDIEASIDKSRITSGSQPSVESTRPGGHIQGNFGERNAAHALQEQGHTILSGKPDTKDTTRGGIDIVTIKDGTVYAIDNKAYTAGKNISTVPALEQNFGKNIKSVRAEFANYAQDTKRPPQERALFKQAVEAIDAGRVQKAVTTAALAPDGKMSSGIGPQLQSKGFVHIDVMAKGDPGRVAGGTSAGKATAGAAQAGEVPRPAATQSSPKSGSPSGEVPRPAATQSSPKSGSPSGEVPRPTATQSSPKSGSPSGKVPRPAATQSSPKSGSPSGEVPRPAATQSSPKSGSPFGVAPRPAATQASPKGGVGGSVAGSNGARPTGPSQAGASTASPTGGTANAGQMGGTPSGSSGVRGPNPSGSSPSGGI